jgi:hypothetical protein
MILTMENRRTRRKICPSATLSTTHRGLTRARSQVSAARHRRLTTCAKVRPKSLLVGLTKLKLLLTRGYRRELLMWFHFDLNGA